MSFMNREMPVVGWVRSTSRPIFPGGRIELVRPVAVPVRSVDAARESVARLAAVVARAAPDRGVVVGPIETPAVDRSEKATERVAISSMFDRLYAGLPAIA